MSEAQCVSGVFVGDNVFNDMCERHSVGLDVLKHAPNTIKLRISTYVTKQNLNMHHSVLNTVFHTYVTICKSYTVTYITEL